MDSQITITSEFIKSIYKPRYKDSHKGSYGHALLIVGTQGKMGAAIIASRACLRAGCGLLTVNVPQSERSILQIAIPEAMLEFREIESKNLLSFNSVGIGPAIGTDEDAMQLFIQVLQEIKSPLLIDADALTLLSLNKEIWDLVPPHSILTPHPKEFDRLFGVHQNIEERLITAQKISIKYGWIIVLKGFQTHVIDNNLIYTNTNGNAGLAKGGTGDLLTGIITSLLAQKYLPIHAACMGVYVHGAAADCTLSTQSMESMLATDVIENIGRVFAKIESNNSEI